MAVLISFRSATHNAGFTPVSDNIELSNRRFPSRRAPASFGKSSAGVRFREEFLGEVVYSKSTLGSLQRLRFHPNPLRSLRYVIHPVELSTLVARLQPVQRIAC